MRISAQLIDATSGAHLWADRFDGSLADIFDLHDKVASTGAGVIEPALQAAETARSANRPTSDLTAYDLYLRAYEMYFASAQLIPDALRLLEQAIKRDPLARRDLTPLHRRWQSPTSTKRPIMYRTIDPLISASRGTLAGDRPLPRSTRSRPKN